MRDLASAFEKACGRFDGENFEQLADVERILVTVWGLEAEVNNGGFDQYYFNSAGDLAFYADAALELIGARQMAAIVRKANALFGPEGPPRDREGRQTELFALTNENQYVLATLSDDFQSYPDDLPSLLIAYVESSGWD